jgi:hypothetical protein
MIRQAYEEEKPYTQSRNLPTPKKEETGEVQGQEHAHHFLVFGLYVYKVVRYLLTE